MHPSPSSSSGSAVRSTHLLARQLSGVRCLAVAGGAVLLALVDPAKTHFFGVCPLYWITGLHCAGCGTLRAAHAILHADLAQAAAYNSMALVTAPVILAWAAAEAIHALTGRRLGPPRGTARLGQILVAMLILYTVARNIPLAPFDILRPHPIAHTLDLYTPHIMTN
jgi:hypothetical protein